VYIIRVVAGDIEPALEEKKKKEKEKTVAAI
jgi:hypothetical protein